MIVAATINTVYLQEVQYCPVQPGAQLHLLGAEHVPPLEHAGLQIAVCKGKIIVFRQ